MGKAKTRGHRLSFYIPENMQEKLLRISEKHHLSLSDFSRNALQKAIDAIEETDLRRELKEGFEANYQYYLAQQEEWKHADSEERGD